MIFTPLFLDGAFLLDLEKREDNRGFFARYFCEREFADHGLNGRWVQMNVSLSLRRGTMRGLHFQRPPKAEVKVVRCLQGAIWDVVVDIRYQSPTYGEWFGTELTAENRRMMYVPQGFAHGFLTLQDNSEILYLVSETYSPEHEGTLIWNDKFHGIEWPEVPVVVSDKDQSPEPWTNERAVRV
ncbi:dTDP-4-dehydrorhamnose 3,5-epimerase [Rhodopirellula sp. SM50]|nr:dTDP-4-dehydrorhamnose 3,5-epimerase [Rhodopirellula sp. SM50]PAY16608.1 dTDP-4-dehydrorhamnose 3,5-epimerase [Rhodopirellula sp. SM50]